MLRINKFVILFSASLAFQAAWGQTVEESQTEVVETASKPGPEQQSVDSDAVSRIIVDTTNEFRTAQDRSQVEVNPQLAETAQYFASYMAKNDVYGHHADGNRPSQRSTKFGYDYCLISENIAYQYDSTGFTTMALAERFVEGWKTSPGHRQNMLDEDVVETGVAVARSGETGYWYAVQMFGRPKTAAIEFEIKNQSKSIVDYEIRDQTFQLPPGYTRTHVRCRPSKVDFGFRTRETIEPSHGRRYTIVGESGNLKLHTQGAVSQ